MDVGAGPLKREASPKKPLVSGASKFCRWAQGGKQPVRWKGSRTTKVGDEQGGGGGAGFHPSLLPPNTEGSSCAAAGFCHQGSARVGQISSFGLKPPPRHPHIMRRPMLTPLPHTITRPRSTAPTPAGHCRLPCMQGQYSLQSIVNHSGSSALCGHFTADVRGPRGWFRCALRAAPPVRAMRQEAGVVWQQAWQPPHLAAPGSWDMVIAGWCQDCLRVVHMPWDVARLPGSAPLLCTPPSHMDAATQ